MTSTFSPQSLGAGFLMFREYLRCDNNTSYLKLPSNVKCRMAAFPSLHRFASILFILAVKWMN